MSKRNLSGLVLLPELKVISLRRERFDRAQIRCQKVSRYEICPRCASVSRSRYDRRKVVIKDEPVRGCAITLIIHKSRFWCKPCAKPFTEPVSGVLPKRRTTQRFRHAVYLACEQMTDLKLVRRKFRCSTDFVYQALYEQLELRRRTRMYPWPSKLGIDEHSFKRLKRYGRMEFATMIVDQKNRKVFDVVEGKTGAGLSEALKEIPGRENVKEVAIDMCDPYRNFIKEFFPNAQIVADKFHVLRLLTPPLLRRRKEITGTRANLKAKKYLLMSSKNLGYFERRAMWDFLKNHPDLHEIYGWKESLHGFYRIKGYDRACIAFKHMLDRMAGSKLKEIKTLRRTLLRWRVEILNYFKTGLTNARTEGFNNRAKLIKRRAYGYKNFNHYRLRLLAACT